MTMEVLLWLSVAALVIALGICYRETYGKKGRRDIF
jgi:hypothetical protein